MILLCNFIFNFPNFNLNFYYFVAVVICNINFFFPINKKNKSKCNFTFYVYVLYFCRGEDNLTLLINYIHIYLHFWRANESIMIPFKLL